MFIYNILEVVYPIMIWAFVIVMFLRLIKFIALAIYGMFLD